VVKVNSQGQGDVAVVRVRYKSPPSTDEHELEWRVPYTGNAVALEQSSPALRLAGTAGAFAEWLASNPYAAEVRLDTLLACVRGIPELSGSDTRPKQLEGMIRQAQRLAGH